MALLGEPDVVGRRIELKPRRGTKIRGRVERLELLPDSNYTRQLADWRDRRQVASTWPEPGAVLHVECLPWWTSGPAVSGESGRFVGLRGHLLLLDVGGDVRVVPLHPNRVRLRGDQGVLDLAWLGEADPQQWPPSREILVVRTRRGEVEVDLDQMRRLDLNRPWEWAQDTGWVLGSLGACVAILSTGLSSSWGGGMSGDPAVAR